MTVDKPALEGFALTSSRRTASGELVLWRSPDVVVQPGQFVVVWGDQAADVQLLLGMLSGLVEPAGGVVRIDGEAMEDLPRSKRASLRAQKLGFLFRQPKLLPDLNVLDNVVLPGRYSGTSRRAAQERGRALLGRLGLAHSLRQRPSALTPLQGQLVVLARALLNRPAIVLADEPTACLSAEDADLFLSLLHEVCQEENVAVLLGTTRRFLAEGGTEEWPRLAQSAAVTTIHLPVTSEPLLALPGTISQADLFTDLYETEIFPLLRPVAPALDLVFKPLLYTAAVAVVIVFLTFFSLRMAQAGQAGQSLDLARGVSNAFQESLSYLGGILHGDLGSYHSQLGYFYWTDVERPLSEAVRRTVDKSLVLLLLSMALGAVIGVPLGLAAAMVRHRRFSLFFLVAAIVGVSTPSFFFALLLQMLEITVYKRTGVALLPVGGFGWDSHIVLPALVLAARPIAQVARVSFVALAQVLDADYVRTAHAKGLPLSGVLFRHALRNAGVPILAAVGTSLRFSLSSLPVVEVIFQWNGMGDLLLQAIRAQNVSLAATLILILGVFFVLIEVALDLIYRWIDPRMREEKSGLYVQRSWVDMLSGSWSSLREIPGRLESIIPTTKEFKEKLVPRASRPESTRPITREQQQRDAKIKHERRRAWIQSTAGSLPFTLGAVVLIALVVMVVFGQQIAPYSPYSPTTSLTTESGELAFAPFAPSAQFLLGTDAQGRDILTLLLYGARRTLSLAFFAVVARVLLGTVLGALSGWFSDSLLDRTLTGLTQVIAAFPSLLLAMVLIYAFGIRQGLWVFALALSLIGWGEVAQFVRGQVMHIREQDYIEGALATGLGDVQLLARHVLPNLVPSLVILACLEMGGVLMILGELGFIGVFIGGGWRTVSAADSLVTYFDVPEWGVMLSATWRTFRSYPWMTFYPALAFTLAILGFNLFGEGLRRLTERLTLSMHRLINRYTIAVALGLGALLLLAAEGTRSWPQFTTAASRFNTERAMADVRYLSSSEMNGRGIDTPELDAASDYIAEQFAALDLQPAGAMVEGKLTYFSQSNLQYRSLLSQPSLKLLDGSGQVLLPLAYRHDYAEMPDATSTLRDYKGEVICVGLSPDSRGGWPESMEVSAGEIRNAVVLLPSGGLPYAVSNLALHGAVLVVAYDDGYITRRQSPASSQLTGPWFSSASPPIFYVSPQVADAILNHAGYSLDEVRQRQVGLQPDEGFALRTGVQAAVDIAISPTKVASPRNVQAFIPGNDDRLDNELVMVLAYYDGQGRDLDGTLYPGANGNASGVAVMLEVARVLKEADYQPRRTIMYVAWAGGELYQPPDFWGILRERPGFLESYRIAAAIDLRMVGEGSGNALLLDRGTSNRLTEALLQAARRSKVSASTLGKGPYGVYEFLYQAPERKIPYIFLTWDGSGDNVHRPEDAIESIQPDKLGDAGRAVALAVMYLGHEKEY
jgi:ABC-type dipeptide/oligopeptide/nickel transport system permease component/ABC-type lipoprotein export system ATPase subunit